MGISVSGLGTLRLTRVPEANVLLETVSTFNSSPLPRSIERLIRKTKKRLKGAMRREKDTYPPLMKPQKNLENPRKPQKTQE